MQVDEGTNEIHTYIYVYLYFARTVSTKSIQFDQTPSELMITLWIAMCVTNLKPISILLKQKNQITKFSSYPEYVLLSIQVPLMRAKFST